ncbi:MAG: 50S ribosomal protein L6 [Mycoplasmataceae bacterium]|jgi:large subunit ribosomal protein L6|nr:50S ribosomal protein L6 [Mycoplasmataceae bacterium]
MSRKGNKLIKVPVGVKVTIGNNDISITGSLGNLKVNYPSDIISVAFEDDGVKVERKNSETISNIFQGTVASNLMNAIHGVSLGYTKKLKIVGVGYKAAVSGGKIEVHAGYSGSGSRKLQIPTGLKVTTPTPVEIIVNGYDKQLVGEFTAKIRDIRRPEPYKGKGIMYSNEIIVRKVGKTAEGSKGVVTK